MKYTRIITLILTMGVLLPVQLSLANDYSLSGSMELVVPKPAQTKADVEAAQKWYPSGEPQGDKGTIWERGTSLNELNRRRAPQNPNSPSSLDTRVGIESQLKGLAEYERSAEKKPLKIADGKIHGDSSVEKTSWKSSITEPIKIDEPVLSSQRSVVGAYADMVEDEDFHMSAGPEIHLPESTSSPLGHSDDRPENSEIGMGMKLMWGF